METLEGAEQNFLDPLVPRICPDPENIKISADFTRNFLISRKSAIKYFKDGTIAHVNRAQIKENMKVYYKGGWEGLDLDLERYRIIMGITYLSTKFKHPEFIECSLSEIYRAAQYKANLSGGQRQRLKSKLEDLSTSQYPIYGTDGNGKRNLSFGSLLNVERKECKKYVIHLNPHIFGTLDDNFRLVNPNIVQEIREYKKPSKYDLRFFFFLLGENNKIIKWNYLKIAGALLMDNQINERQEKRIRERVNSLYQTFLDLGYLRDVTKNHKGVRDSYDILMLNPDKIYGLRDGK